MMYFSTIIFMLVSGSAGTMRGREFVVTFFEKKTGTFAPSTNFVFLSEENTTVHMESSGFNIAEDIDVEGMKEKFVSFHHGNFYKGNLDVTNLTFHITSSEDISVFCYNYEANMGDGYAALPVPVLSTAYMVVTNTRINDNPTISGLTYTNSEHTVFVILATEDNTQVNIHLRIRGSHMSGGCGNGTFFDGDTRTYTLNRNQVVGAYCEDDITGTIIQGDKPIGVISGHNYDITVFTSSAGHSVEMLLPIDSLGRSFVLLEPPDQPDGALYRVVGSQAGTSVRTSGGQIFTVGEGDPYDLHVNSTTGPLYLEADKPVTVVAFSKTKTSMTLIPPTSLYSHTYDIAKAHFHEGDPSFMWLKDFYLTVIVPTDDVLGIQPDVFPQFTVIEGSCFSFATVVLDIGFYKVFHEDGVQFGTMVHFYSALNTLFSHPGGFNMTADLDKTTCPPSDICSDGTPYPCSCASGYFEYTCTDTSPGCASSPCSVYNSTCISLTNSYRCDCVHGSGGAHCEHDIFDDCQVNACVNGTCIDELNAFWCNCTPGFEGAFCEIDIDDCATNPCVNGTCTDLVNMYNCTCLDGFKGINCDTDINECDSIPCQNNGTCTDLLDAFECACVDGYNGTLCENDIDDCATNPCVNGTCTDLVNMYNCTCLDGFKGINCDTEINECDSIPCQNNGTCTDLLDAFECACVEGYNGTLCENDIDDCATNPCVNGTCTDLVNMYNCTCLDGFKGINCDTEIDECATSPCQNGASCEDLVNAFVCTCSPGFNGTLCDNEINECSGNPCVNEGNCTDLLNGYSCTCPDGISGTNCEIVTCATSPCQNNASCTDSPTGFNCSCATGFQGDLCEIDIDECATGPCKNDGTCVDEINDFRCLCPANFTGLLCELFLNCGCPCLLSGNITDEELAKKIALWKSILLLDKSQLSKQVRKKISIPDDRPASTGIGASGIFCLIVAFGFFVITDALNVVKLLTNRKSISNMNTKPQKESQDRTKSE